MLLAEVAATADVSQDHRQLAVYAMACLSSAARLYTTGIFVDGFQITMFYYDRRLVARSLSFDFRKQPQYLAVLVYAMLCSDYRNDGLNIYLHEKSCTDTACKGCIGSSMKDACFRFPFDASTKIPGQNKDSKPLETPTLPIDGSQLFAVFNIGDLIHEAIGIMGRATVVYRVNPQDIPGIKKKDLRSAAALKMSWQPPYRCIEMNIIARLLERAPECKPYLPEILYGGVFSAEALGLPSAMKTIPTDKLPDFVQRALHVIVSRLYHKIWTAKTIPEFLKIWLHCVKCHQIAWKKAGVLHRDLSDNNLMFALSQTKPEGERVLKGILNDWDMASALNDDGNFEVSTATHRTGTLPFMSPDLLVAKPPRHYYRHDLESFVWILLNAMVRYDLPNRCKKPLPKDLRQWEGPTIGSARAFKDFALGSAGADTIRTHVREDWKSSFETLGASLLRLVSRAHLTKHWAEEMMADAPFDYETCNGSLTYEKFMEIASPHVPTPSA
ncbi:hypothetical protein BKA70DRAFT_1204064 [Coprinopsis sp. MPI-PUGE-AT-0042]|nr:hypothetical protein BKA70DRAFT_1204064 [Coprinopsis sp. MPI-PUGE-AT-0042]